MSKSTLNLKTGFAVCALATVIMVSGCHEVKPPIAIAAGTASTTAFKPENVPAGFPIGAGGADMVQKLIASKSFSSRGDAFGLLGVERQYDNSQLAERLVSEAGWSVRFSPPAEEVVPEPDEAQPYRRLAGILQSDTVSALIILEDGRAEIVWPGKMIPNTEWRVVSIDGDKAVLRRGGTRRPKQIEIRLEPDVNGGAPAGAGNAGGGGRGNNPGGGGPRGGGPRGGGGGGDNVGDL